MIKLYGYDKNTATKVGKILLCLCVGLICYHFSLYSLLTYDTNDDPASMILLATGGNSFSPLFAKPLSVVLSLLYQLSPLHPWWIYITLATVSFSLSVVLYLLARRYKFKIFAVLSVLVVYLFMETAVCRINFTKTAAVAAVAGILLILQGIEDFSLSKLLSIIELVVGVGLWIFGAMIRSQIAFVVLPFAAVYLCYMIVSAVGIKDMNRLLKEASKPLLISVIALAFALCLLFAGNLFLSEEERADIAYYDARISVQDYADNFPEYSQAAEEYQALGVSENDYHMIFDDWTTEDPQFFTTELFQSMREELYRPNTISQAFEVLVDYFSSNSGFIVVYFLVITALFLSTDNKKRIAIVAFLAVVVSYIIALAVLGRVVDRVVYPALLYASTFSLFFCVNFAENKKKAYLTGPIFITILTAFLFCFMMIPTFNRNIAGYSYNKYADHSSGTYSINAQNFYIKIAEDKDIAYILPLMNSFEFLPSEGLYPRYQPSVTMFENLFFLGGWDARIRTNYDRLDDFDIENPMQALFLNTNVLTGYDKEVHTYLKEHYHENISISQADSFSFVNGIVYGLFQYCLPIEGEILDIEGHGDIYIESYNYEEENLSYSESPGGGTVNLSGAVGKNIDEYEELFLNVDTPEGRRSYRIFVDSNGNFECRAFGLTKEDVANSELYVVAKTYDDEYIKLTILGEYIEV